MHFMGRMEDRSSTLTFCKHSNFMLFLLLAIMFVLGAAHRGLERVSKKDVKMDKHLKHVSSHIIKTFKMDNDDIVDCVDIYNQSTLTHPLLKNHRIQLKPKSCPKGMFTGNLSSLVFSEMIECPQGYVPIKRESKEDLIKLTEHLNNETNPGFDEPSLLKKYYDAKLVFRHGHHGASGHINVWGFPHFPEDQLTIASIWIADGPPEHEDDIVAGWIVYPSLFKDITTRLFVYWSAVTSRTFGCFNTLCPGFVQISKTIYLGGAIKPLSIYTKEQYTINIQIYQDLSSKHWWLRVGGENVGYWPWQLFTHLKDGANYSSWGGRVINPSGGLSAPMGSGIAPLFYRKPIFDFYGKVAYIAKIEVNLNNIFSDPLNVKEVATDYNCYAVKYDSTIDDYLKHHIFFGGRSRCTIG